MHHMILFTFIFTGWLSFTLKKGPCQQVVIVKLPNSSLFFHFSCAHQICVPYHHQQPQNLVLCLRLLLPHPTKTNEKKLMFLVKPILLLPNTLKTMRFETQQ